MTMFNKGFNQVEKQQSIYLIVPKMTLPHFCLSFSATCIYIFLTKYLVVASFDEYLCSQDDGTNDLPIFIEKRKICNFDTVPISIYSIKITPDTDYSIKFCLKGDFASSFDILNDSQLRLIGRLEGLETSLELQIIRQISIVSDIDDIIGRRQTVNAILFIFEIEECNQVSWQTIVVAILSSACIILMSFLAILLIIFQQNGLIRTKDDDSEDERNDHGNKNDPENSSYSRPSDETFINPRRTSSNPYQHRPEDEV